MDITELKRNSKAVISALRERSDKSIVTTELIHITIPQKYLRDGLIDMGDTIRIIGLFAFILGDKTYAVSNALAMLPITPDETSTYTVEETVYNLYTFYPGSVVIPNRSLVKTGTFAYYVYNTIMSKGYVPWYYRPSDKTQVFDSSNIHAGTGTGCTRNIISLHTALLTRAPNDESTQFRFVAKSQDDMDNLTALYVGAKNVSAAVDGTIPAITGSYASEGFTGALVNPTTETTSMEDALTGKL